MAKSMSPLRYPGGKSKIYSKVKNLIETNALNERTYIEPFAGGFGIGIRLLLEKVVKTAVLNDFDPHIYNFWFSVLNNTDELIQKIIDTPITLEERENQKVIYGDSTSDVLSDGFATLFLNRVNFSGVIKGGAIGGSTQNGQYKIDCRFNKNDIINKIQNIAKLSEHIEVFNYDASKLIKQVLNDRIHTSFFNIDPPYVNKGQQLYTNYFNEVDHIELESTISEYLAETFWITTYDDCELIRKIYKNYCLSEYSIQHNAGRNIKGRELVITNIPENSFVW